MAIPNRISETIPQTVIDKVIDLLNQVNTELEPYVIEALSKPEDDSLAKLGEKSEPFTEKGVDFALTNPQFMPSWVSTAEAQKDLAVFHVLRPIDILLQQIAGEVSSTRTVAGAEALSAINVYYKSVSDAHKQGVAAATPIFEELRKRYIDNGKRKKKPTDLPA